MEQLPTLLACTQEQLAAILAEAGETKSYRVTQLAEWIWKKGATNFEQMSNLPPTLRRTLTERYTLRPLAVTERRVSVGGTRKLLCRLQDGELVETVIIPAALGENGSQSQRLTLCISSQVGCSFGCKFCASGLHGLKRSLSVGEIIGQIAVAQDEADDRVDNLVFMGMGEPLDNLENLLPALRLIIDPHALGISPRHITISTSGNVPGLKKLAQCGLPVRLAVSLHGATDEVRSRIMPVNRKWPLSELLSALEEWRAGSKHMITLEYILIAGVNDMLPQADLLADIARRLRAKINLIPCNPVPNLDWQRPAESVCRAFCRSLLAHHVPVTMRYEKGADIDAACGQLRRRTIERQ